MRGRVWFALGVIAGSLTVPLGALVGRAVLHRTIL